MSYTTYVMSEMIINGGKVRVRFSEKNILDSATIVWMKEIVCLSILWNFILEVKIYSHLILFRERVFQFGCYACMSIEYDEL